MSAFERFRLEVTLRCPGIFDGYTTLESLLAAAVHEQCGKEREDALALVPIARQADLWQASGLFYSGFSGYTEQAFIRSRRRSEIGPDHYAGRPLKSKRGKWYVEQGSGDYKRLINTYRSAQCRRLVWFAEGDADACMRLMLSLMAIGKRRGQGFGEIESAHVFGTDESPLVDPLGMVRRPIPLQLLDAVPDAAPARFQRKALETWRHPFWDCERVPCAVPQSQNLDLVEMGHSAAEMVSPEVFFR